MISKDELRQTISRELIKAGINDLTVELPITTAVWNLLDSKPTRIGTEAAMAEGASLEQRVRSDIERCFRISPNWKVKTWEETTAYIRMRYEKGETVERFSRWWYESDWRGVSGQPPAANQIRELWPQAFTADPAQGGIRDNGDGSIN